jgi:ribose transport system substrate-binding protein
VASLTALTATGVPVIQTNQKPFEGTEETLVGYAGVDDTLNGEVAGELVVEARDALVESGAELHSDGGNAVIVGFVPGYQAGIDRSAAAVPILEAAGINVLGQVDVGFDPTTGYEGMNELIAAHEADGIDLVYAHNSALAEGAIQALEEAGYTPGEDVMVVGGTCHGNLENLENGKEFATGLQAAYLEGVFSIRTLDEYLTSGELAEFYNFIPNPPVHGDEIDTVTLEGQSVEELCVY